MIRNALAILATLVVLYLVVVLPLATLAGAVLGNWSP